MERLSDLLDRSPIVRMVRAVQASEQLHDYIVEHAQPEWWHTTAGNGTLSEAPSRRLEVAAHERV